MSHAHKLLDGRSIAAGIRETVSKDVEALKKEGWPIKLVSISIGDVDASALYVRNQQRAAEKVGIEFEARNYQSDISRDELVGIIQGLNTDPRVTGIIIQRPTPKHLTERRLQRTVHPLKDVEGMHPSNIGDIVYNDLKMGPCTAVAAVELLKATGVNLEGLEVTVIGHSAIVGKPIAFLLMAQGATVTVCHHETRNIAMHSRSADAVFVAVGKPGLVTANMLKPGAVLIDIGINQIDGPDGPKVVGDADFDSCSEVAGWITPVPGGVGPVTVAMLLRNAVTAARLQRDHYATEFATRTSA
ncbi:bifunctional 5,10-methylenetetrahydrofolate dehydrogenase/5,10-methenyltetrahydrofolate cyclohydrolase [Hoeflea prorocentri]|uniref:Bifunctional protein FolD n=1 Tax=Hoeflea prorocentri TaxID=1922333 RepID=A0A9X3UF07_9HYPH|nr:bifunctional 5,10-methylenetetrahydrofolate dehydrogenase/5,10-methenyltetrahydrofolate cyclohydrolase [Hoeflea prorocentri]MCY6380087.1 bifunctional 5,10-methylenetetrahydrofolate dehydrogenase/5,10-methenyltetrahydrofolate cyclohydrolase [Hoeflea prorocentri]MDA5397887.1 bifunctional 5,10-methylenetetrahydrofolate dehydrogenase/5,10-methenyltetrahydrofolate cyclohydrolase [Hoeflea prorocentri]